MDFENYKCAAQFPFAQPSGFSSSIPNATSFINFGLNVLATGHVDCRADNPDFCYHATFKLFVFSKVQISKSA